MNCPSCDGLVQRAALRPENPHRVTPPRMAPPYVSLKRANSHQTSLNRLDSQRIGLCQAALHRANPYQEPL